MTINDPALEPPERKDFRRVNRGVPLVLDPATGNMVRYRRASTAGNILDDDSNLVDWRIRTIVYGCAQRPDLMAQVSTLDQEADKKELRDIAEDCLVAGKGMQRAVTGTAIHRMLDHVDLGDDWTPAPQFQAAVDSYIKTRDNFGLVPVDVEVRCVNDLYRIAGTMDRRYRTTRNLVVPTGEIVPIGTLLAGDTKTGRSLEYAAGSYTTQLGGYVCGAVRYDVDTNERTPFDPPTFQDWAIIVHVDADDARTDIYWVDLEAGRHALALADSVRQWRARTDLITPARPPLYPVGELRTHFGHVNVGADLPVDPVADADLEAQLATRQRHPTATTAAEVPTVPVDVPAAPERPDDASERLAAVRAWLRERIARIREAGEAPTGMLLRQWPAGVDGLKHDTQTEAQLDAISEVLWDVEKIYALPFSTPDPRTPVEERSITDRWRKPTGKDRPKAERDVMAFRTELDNHPRRALLERWAVMAIVDRTTDDDTWALAHALYEFGKLSLDEWSDDTVTLMLDGTLRAIGYPGGINELHMVTAMHAPLIMSSAFAITAGSAMLLFGDDDLPVVRTIS